MDLTPLKNGFSGVQRLETEEDATGTVDTDSSVVKLGIFEL